MRGVVLYTQMTDLIFKSKYISYLNEKEEFIIPFIEWVKAGVAFNHRIDDPSRCVAYFAELFYSIENNSLTKEQLKEAVRKYYEDLYSYCMMFIQYSLAKDAKNGVIDHSRNISENLLILPSFSGLKYEGLLEEISIDFRDLPESKQPEFSIIDGGNLLRNIELYKVLLAGEIKIVKEIIT